MTQQQHLQFTHYPHPCEEAIIIIHGLLGCKDNWRSIAKQLNTFSNIYCVDCRNHGESFHSQQMSYQDMSNDIERLCDHLNIKNATILGHSMGGKIAMHCLQQNARRYKKGIIVDIAPKSYAPHHHLILNSMKAVSFSTLLTRTAIDTFLATTIPDVAIRQLLLKNIKRNQNNHFYWQCNVTNIIQNYEHIMEHSLSNTPISVPTLFLRGSLSDYIRNPADYSQIHQHFTNATIKTINGAGHWVQSQKPQEFLEHVTTFINEH